MSIRGVVGVRMPSVAGGTVPIEVVVNGPGFLLGVPVVDTSVVFPFDSI
jgi:hypothetical protein